MKTIAFALLMILISQMYSIAYIITKKTELWVMELLWTIASVAALLALKIMGI